MSNKNLSQPIRGSRDLYPEDLAIRKWIFDSWRKVAQSFGYQEIDGPILESFDLFAAKSGQELVNSQMYTLTDRDNKKLGIRPEITPTYSRMVAKKQGSLAFPLRWMMFGNAWRYEKPQRGRVRDFWQWELNLIGGDENVANAEVIAIAANALKSIGFTSEDIVFRINDRKFMQNKYQEIGIDNSNWKKVSQVIDKIERMSETDFVESLKKIDLDLPQIEKLSAFLKSKDYSHSQSLTKLFSLLDNFGVSEYVEYDPVIVRGLDYYTGLVFECFDKSKKFRSVFGGGRFDDLVETFGGGKVPAVGFAIGDVVVPELLKEIGKLPSLETIPTKVLVTIFEDDLLPESINIANILRNKSINTELYPDETVKLDKQLKYANKKGIPYVVIIGPEESEKSKVVLKNMTTGEQKTTDADKLASLLN